MKSLRGVRRASSFLQLRLLSTSKHSRSIERLLVSSLTICLKLEPFTTDTKFWVLRRPRVKFRIFSKFTFSLFEKSRIFKQVLGAFQFELTQNKFGLTFTFGRQRLLVHKDNQDIAVLDSKLHGMITMSRTVSRSTPRLRLSSGRNSWKPETTGKQQ